MSATLTALGQLQNSSLSLPSATIPVHREHTPVKEQLTLLTELTFIYILRLLGVEDAKKLSEILSHLRKGTLFYDFTFLAQALSKSETDFDFLTMPENLALYAKIADIASLCNIQLLPYVSVLARIAENKQYGLYQENQEVGFFLDEYAKYKDTVDAAEFLHQFRKILKLRTQQVFTRFIHDGIFSVIKQTLSDNAEKISDEHTLAIYVYALHYYESLISNDGENFLHEHIDFCVKYLAEHEGLTFLPRTRTRYFPQFKSDTEAVEYFFENNREVRSSLDRFIGLFKDICPVQDVYDFCAFVREYEGLEPDEKFDDSTSSLKRLITRLIKNAANYHEKTGLYNRIVKLLPFQLPPTHFRCIRYPDLAYYGGYRCYVFASQEDESQVYYAHITGCFSERIAPPPNTPIQVDTLKYDERGIILTWLWQEIAHETQIIGTTKEIDHGIQIICTPINTNRTAVKFNSLEEAAKYLNTKEFEIKRCLATKRPLNGYIISKGI